MELKPNEIRPFLEGLLGKRFVVKNTNRGVGESTIPAGATGEVLYARMYTFGGRVILETALDGIGRRELWYKQVRILSPLEELANV